jgi:uncharacterized membrane protein
MSAPLRFLSRQIGYDLRSGLLFRPALLIAALAALALVGPSLEVRLAPEASAWLATEPGAAQVVLSTVAGSMMTVVSVVYSILLVALSLASMQFSTRILAGMMRDRVSQNTLGLFVGTFVYCLLLLRAVHGDPAPFVPGISLTFALVLALASLGGLVFFIHHIIRSIQANHLVERIATETEGVIDAVFPERLGPGEAPAEHPVPEPPPGAVPVRAVASGYVQLIDVDSLRAIASQGYTIHVVRGMGSFAAEGIPVALVAPAPPPPVLAAILAAFDLGPVRTMQQDAEFGVRQIVDIALKAISPAVNDPSTAATCIDHLTRLLVRVAGRRTPVVTPVVVTGGVYVPTVTHADLVDLSFEQLRQYGRSDMAVALRLLRALGDVASVTTQPFCLARIEQHARLIEAAARAAFPEEDCDELGRRRAAVARYTAADRPAGAPPA